MTRGDKGDEVYEEEESSTIEIWNSIAWIDHDAKEEYTDIYMSNMSSKREDANCSNKSFPRKS